MARRLATCVLALVCASSSPAYAFFEEGNDAAMIPGYLRCNTLGDLKEAEVTGCNPWPDWDANYTLHTSHDMKKSSFHFNLTAAMAVAAGYSRCAAYIIALYDEGADVATRYDQELWTPFPNGVSPNDSQCQAMLEEAGVEVRMSVSGQLGGYVTLDFTHRSFGDPATQETNRESDTYHWTHSPLNSPTRHACSSGADPRPIDQAGVFVNMVTLSELQAWAGSSPVAESWYNPFHDCPYRQDDDTLLFGPVVAYDPRIDPVIPGSLGAIGLYLHSVQDSFSHMACSQTTHSFIADTDAPCGFVSSHYAGEYGTIDHQASSGLVTVRTPASSVGYRVALHSASTRDAALTTYSLLESFLETHLEWARSVDLSEDCSASVNSFAEAFASIPNGVPARGEPSGAKRRSDLADSLFASDQCQFEEGP